MHIRTEKGKSGLGNNVVKWFLFDEQLWITKYNDYSQIENIVDKMVGSYNWLYDANDTLLFENTDGRFNTAIIRLSGIVDNDDTDSKCTFDNEEEGILFLNEKIVQDYEFPQKVIYSEATDLLYAIPDDCAYKRISTLFITEDFGFVITDNQLIGWILKNATQYIYYCDKKMIIEKEILSQYINAIKQWDEGNKKAVGDLIKYLDSKEGDYYVIMKNVLENLW